MTVKELARTLSLEPLCEADPDRDVTGGYAGDLLSWVMGRAKSGDAWITIMTNVNILAVASLADTSCIIIAENSEVDPSIISTAENKHINLFRSGKSTFELCCAVGRLIGN